MAVVFWSLDFFQLCLIFNIWACRKILLSVIHVFTSSVLATISSSSDWVACSVQIWHESSISYLTQLYCRKIRTAVSSPRNYSAKWHRNILSAKESCLTLVVEYLIHFFFYSIFVRLGLLISETSINNELHAITNTFV